jgi:hypothetical protein
LRRCLRVIATSLCLLLLGLKIRGVLKKIYVLSTRDGHLREMVSEREGECELNELLVSERGREERENML